MHDLQATILELMGIDHTRLSFNFQGLDFRLTGVEPHHSIQNPHGPDPGSTLIHLPSRSIDLMTTRPFRHHHHFQDAHASACLSGAVSVFHRLPEPRCVREPRTTSAERAPAILDDTLIMRQMTEAAQAKPWTLPHRPA